MHAQAIALPLSRRLPMPPEAAATAATRVWTMGWPFWARRRLRAALYDALTPELPRDGADADAMHRAGVAARGLP